MKNFPHQFNDLEKLYSSLEVVKQLIDEDAALTDENFGEKLTREEIYTFRDDSLTIEEYLEQQQEKSPSNRGYLTVARDIRRLFQLLGFLTVYKDKTAELSSSANELLNADTEREKKSLWRNSFLQLGLEGTDGEISHPYRILLRLVDRFPGIQNKKLMLCLEAENDSEEEMKRVTELAKRNFKEIVESIGTSEYMAANAVKILPAVAEQLGDIKRVNHRTYPTTETIVTEDDILTEKYEKPGSSINVRSVNANEIAVDPTFSDTGSSNIDLTDAIHIRQKRLAEHQEIVRQLAELNEGEGLDLYEGKFDCLAVEGNKALLYEVKTILESNSDQEKQTIKGVGQLKFYNFDIVKTEMGYDDVEEMLVFSQKPNRRIIDFCINENILVIWKTDEGFQFLGKGLSEVAEFNPSGFL